MPKKKNVMVFIEQDNREIAHVSLELISEATLLAKKLGVGVEAVAIGHKLKDKLKVLGHYGCDKVYYIDDKRLDNFTSIPYAKAIVKVVKKYSPQIVLFGASTTGRDVAPRVSSELKCGLTADCTELRIGEHKIKDKVYENILLQVRPAFGGNIIATIVSPEVSPSMATVREGVMKLNTPDLTRKMEIIDEEMELGSDLFLTEIIEVLRAEKAVDFKSANIIVSVGMGACNDASLGHVKSLANCLGGVVGASRPVVDSGLLAKDHQIGQTGVTVRPVLYIACGISGQIQHRAGMAESKRIIAINSDPNAPIFGIAHYGIVGDINEVIPKMIKAYQQKD